MALTFLRTGLWSPGSIITSTQDTVIRDLLKTVDIGMVIVVPATFQNQELTISKMMGNNPLTNYGLKGWGDQSHKNIHQQDLGHRFLFCTPLSEAH